MRAIGTRPGAGSWVRGLDAEVVQIGGAKVAAHSRRSSHDRALRERFLRTMHIYIVPEHIYTRRLG